jgi:hypothetical protein
MSTADDPRDETQESAAPDTIEVVMAYEESTMRFPVLNSLQHKSLRQQDGVCKS